MKHPHGCSENVFQYNAMYILANVIAVDMHNAFMLASCVTFTTKLQILVVMIFLKFSQLWVHWFSELVGITQQSFLGKLKMVQIVSNDDVNLQWHRDVKMFLQLIENFLNVTNDLLQQFNVKSFHVDCDIELSQVVQMLYKQLNKGGNSTELKAA